MRYALKIAARYLTASKAQTALLVLGVAVGVFIFIFMSALIGGLAEFILSRTVGDIPHITITAEDADPPLLINPPGQILLAAESGGTRTATLSQAATWAPLIAGVPGVTAVSPQITGAGFLTRGAQVSQVSITGVEPGLDPEPCRLYRRRVRAARGWRHRHRPRSGGRSGLVRRTGVATAKCAGRHRAFDAGRHL
jgi:lipoprotein-releasing system permease protein